MAMPADGPTGRNLTVTRAVRPALGHSRDVPMIGDEVRVLEIDAPPRGRGDRFEPGDATGDPEGRLEQMETR